MKTKIFNWIFKSELEKLHSEIEKAEIIYKQLKEILYKREVTENSIKYNFTTITLKSGRKIDVKESEKELIGTIKESNCFVEVTKIERYINKDVSGYKAIKIFKDEIESLEESEGVTLTGYLQNN